MFKNKIHSGFSYYLDSLNISWSYRTVVIPYVDHITGKHKKFVIDFSTPTEWIEMVLQDRMIPIDGRLYTQMQAYMQNKRFRGITKDERKLAIQLGNSDL